MRNDRCHYIIKCTETCGRMFIKHLLISIRGEIKITESAVRIKHTEEIHGKTKRNFVGLGKIMDSVNAYQCGTAKGQKENQFTSKVH